MTIDEFIAALSVRKDITEFVHHEEVPATEAEYSVPKDGLHPEVERRLQTLGITQLYSHQAAAIDNIRAGRNVVTMTPTSSGKSLVYNIPVIEAALTDPDSTALYLFPLKGLEQNQLRALKNLTKGLSVSDEIETEENEGNKKKRRRAFAPGFAEVYDGDTTSYRKKRIRDNPPTVILTNPDMLHYSINAYHEKWERFLTNLRFIVVDEIHTYRGVFGSHVAHVLRRLLRILKKYGSSPQFIGCSATIANSGELASMLTGREFEVISESGAPAGKKNFLFLNPPKERSPYTAANKLFVESIKAGFRTIAFTKARKITELMYSWVKEREPEVGATVASYRAGFLPKERREIENQLFAGELAGVITTSALELGVDIGGLDVCILVGYPGSVTSTWQRSGRVGRSGRESLIVLIALSDALDQYFMKNPTDFFRRSVESAIIDKGNRPILKSHLRCAAAELRLGAEDSVYDTKRLSPVLQELEAEGALRHWKKGDIWYPRSRAPHRDVSIRQAGITYTIRVEDGSAIGTTNSGRVLRENHPGAIYLHRSRQYRVVKLDMGNREVVCREVDSIDYYTRAISIEETEIIDTDVTDTFSTFDISHGTLRATETVVGYRKKNIYSDTEMGEYLLELPPSIFTTKGIWFKVDEELLDSITAEGQSSTGGLHALEHAMIATLPLFALCDRMDLGGVSYAFNEELQSPAVFIYDGHEGGIGLTRRGFDCFDRWLRATYRLMEECDCEVSCPSCTQDSNCGNNNEPLDKRVAMALLENWLGYRPGAE
ncbi:MAG: DEAD/DEAH box helicase [Proteobacteria bacterium]|nr:DEAD/DEAH box helicase [Pseudomonadota bacterium]